MKKIISTLLLLIHLAIPSYALANSTTTNNQETPIKQNFIPPTVKPSLLPGPKFANDQQRTGTEVTEYVTEKVLPKIASRLITIIAILAMLGIIYGGIMFILASGDSDRATTAKNIAIYSVVGLIIALLSFTIVQIITLLPLNSL